VSKIYLRLEEIGGSSDAIQLNRKPIAAFFLWATRVEILDESQRSDPEPNVTRRRLLELWDQIHLASPALAATYLDVLLSYVDVNHGRVTVCRGSEHGARVASFCLLRALSGIDLTSATLEDIHHRYVTVIPPDANFEGLLCYHAINAVHATLVDRRTRRSFSWMSDKPYPQERVFFANTLARVAHMGKQHGKVPRWILRFVFHSLPQDSPSSVPVIIDCLTIVAIDLECDMSEGNARNLDERYAHLA